MRSEMLFTDRIQRTGNRFADIGASFQLSLLNGTQAITLFIITSKNTVLSMNNGSNQVTLFVSITDAIAFNFIAGSY